MTTLIQLQKRSHGTARDKGWWDGYRDGNELHFPNIPHLVAEKVVLVHSEISEALEDFRAGKMVTELLPSGKPVGFPTEIADIAIRWMDLFGALKIVPASSEGTIAELSPGLYADRLRRGWFRREDLSLSLRGDDSVVPQTLCRLHYGAAQSTEVFGGWAGGACYDRALEVLGDVMALAYHLKIDLEAEIQKKQDYNDTRSHRHGGKRV